MAPSADTTAMIDVYIIRHLFYKNIIGCYLDRTTAEHVLARLPQGTFELLTERAS